MSIQRLSRNVSPCSFAAAKQPPLKQDSVGRQLIPVIASIAFGVLFTPHFVLGFAAGMAILAVNSMIALATNTATPSSDKQDKKDGFSQFLQASSIFKIGIQGPVKEEIYFRGGQMVAIRAAQVALPLILGVVLTASQLLLISVVGVIATSILFGSVHLTNDHADAKKQAVLSTLSGLVYGGLAEKYGIFASIAAHIANNTFAFTAMKFAEGESALKTRVAIPV